jgi:divalent metal cation (Fe/Co/Zn/Cd) transporter
MPPSGAERHIEMHLVIHPDTTVAAAHALSHEIEAAIADQWPDARTTVHIEPTGPNRRDDVSCGRDEPKVRTDESSPDEREFIH